MPIQPFINAAYVEVQRLLGFKPDVKRRLNALLRRPVEQDFRVLAHYVPMPGRPILDVGANRGETIAATRLFLAHEPIIAFEPNPLLVENISLRFERDAALTVNGFGLGREAGTFDLFVPYYKGVPFDGLSSFYECEAATWLNADRLKGFRPEHQTIRRMSCRVRVLDELGLAPGFIKIDVQGYEADVIAGGARTIALHKPPVLMENNRPEHDAGLLLRLGYEPYAYRAGSLHRGEFGALNTFYIHADARAAFSPSLYA